MHALKGCHVETCILGGGHTQDIEKGHEDDGRRCGCHVKVVDLRYRRTDANRKINNQRQVVNLRKSDGSLHDFVFMSVRRCVYVYASRKVS